MESLDSIIGSIVNSLRGDLFWEPYLSKAISTDLSPVGIHLAIFNEPYLTYILENKKTVESRFGIKRCAPFGKVSIGDILLLKRSSGPIVGICKVTDVWFYYLTPNSWKYIRKEFTDRLCAQDPVFWEKRESASFATLMCISMVRNIQDTQFQKTDRRGWVILRSPLYNPIPAL
jgi:hypothetical protein